MDTLNTIKHYIDNTPATSQSYSIKLSEMDAIVDYADDQLIEAIWLAFSYGRAKGYRAAMKGVRK